MMTTRRTTNDIEWLLTTDINWHTIDKWYSAPSCWWTFWEVKHTTGMPRTSPLKLGYPGVSPMVVNPMDGSPVNGRSKSLLWIIDQQVIIKSYQVYPNPKTYLFAPENGWWRKMILSFLGKTYFQGAKLLVFYGGVSLCVSKLKTTTKDDRLESPFPMTPCVPLLQCSNNGVNLGPATWWAEKTTSFKCFKGIPPPKNQQLTYANMIHKWLYKWFTQVIQCVKFF